MLSSTTDHIIPNSILEWFLKDHVTLKTGVMMLKIQLGITGIKYILKYIKRYILLFHNVIFLIKCSLNEYKCLFLNLTNPKPLHSNVWMLEPFILDKAPMIINETMHNVNRNSVCVVIRLMLVHKFDSATQQLTGTPSVLTSSRHYCSASLSAETFTAVQCSVQYQSSEYQIHSKTPTWAHKAALLLHHSDFHICEELLFSVSSGFWLQMLYSALLWSGLCCVSTDSTFHLHYTCHQWEKSVGRSSSDSSVAGLP